MSGRTDEVNRGIEGVAAFVIAGDTRHECRSGW
jgi:hypothetical protein